MMYMIIQKYMIILSIMEYWVEISLKTLNCQLFMYKLYTNTHPKHDLCKEKIYADEPFIQNLV